VSVAAPASRPSSSPPLRRFRRPPRARLRTRSRSAHRTPVSSVCRARPVRQAMAVHGCSLGRDRVGPAVHARPPSKASYPRRRRAVSVDFDPLPPVIWMAVDASVDEHSGHSPAASRKARDTRADAGLREGTCIDGGGTSLATRIDRRTGGTASEPSRQRSPTRGRLTPRTDGRRRGARRVRAVRRAPVQCARGHVGRRPAG
jgi:hypothetical protein